MHGLEESSKRNMVRTSAFLHATSFYVTSPSFLLWLPTKHHLRKIMLPISAVLEQRKKGRLATSIAFEKD